MAKRGARTKIKRGKRTQVKRDLRRDEYVIYRDRRGRIRKPRRDLLLFAEVRSRKTKSRVGYLNKFKKGKPIPSRFAPKQRAVLEAQVEERIEDIDFEQKDLSFTLYSHTRLDEQITRDFYERVMELVEYEGSIILETDISTNLGETMQVPGWYLDYRWPYNLFVTEYVHLILGALNEINVRMSPKKFAKRRLGKRITRALYLKIGYRKK